MFIWKRGFVYDKMISVCFVFIIFMLMGLFVYVSFVWILKEGVFLIRMRIVLEWIFY